ncbi:bifunctional glycosyltransferase family 2/GtrA family protein [Curtobacterium sp. VKM Ac-2922]|uniref:bifunctional glycosyltransferase family 2/GtrA family protein n=1 Tax=Curtobacterium sp. VKM Ac-2922 TaxID=2929475 RepID=UPI001FB34047|nr:bifunctional glycosyltransferase family 2/GtrA family protein [Curtobacterium sp. VKM Ac-2922]MCJ1714313.1 bifunctional glycosyltransferase family 2/GtrA family protein [Curtobacterium sp. VKM Ac-2922]
MTETNPTLDIDIVVPCYNEQDTLAAHVRRLHTFCRATFPQRWRITIADNASTDDTARIADDLAAMLPEVHAVHLPEKGRGRALKAVWGASPARVLVYVDEDLSTDLAALEPLVAPLLSGHSDLAIGTRLAGSSRVVRGGKREFISRSYNLLLRTTMGVSFSDAQCGFKAITRQAAEHVLPLCEDDAWFFDTEMLVLAEHAGLRVHEVPVDWIDDVNSSVDIASTATEDLRGMWRVSRGLATGRIPVAPVYQAIGRQPFTTPHIGILGQVLRFGAIGIASTIAFAVLYALFRPAIGAQTADFLALLVTAVGNTALNRRFTFGVRGRAGAGMHQVQGLVVFGIAWAITSGALVVLHATTPGASHGAEIAVLTGANLLATLVRFVLFKAWVFRARRRPELIRPGTTPAAEATTEVLPVHDDAAQ